MICGRSRAVADELRAMPRRIPISVKGFTRGIPYHMDLADFFIGKPGPGSISKASAKRLPVIVQRNAWTMAHERCSADWILERAPDWVSAIHNRAAYEIPDLLDGILTRRRPGMAVGSKYSSGPAVISKQATKAFSTADALASGKCSAAK